MWNCNNPYRDRDETLRRLGFDSYRAYLRSPLWQSIKKRVFRNKPGNRCVRCGKTGARRLQIHHRSYDLRTLSGADLRSLSIVCRKCHCAAEKPTDFSRSSHDRLNGANQAILAPSKPTRLERCWAWYEKHKRWAPLAKDAAEARWLIETYRQRATTVDGLRCLVCGRQGVNPRTPFKVTSAGYPCCGHHYWGAIRAAVDALRIDLTDD